MAFISEQDRGLFLLNLETAHIGPGAYQTENHNTIQKKSMGYAPFGSTSHKKQIQKPHNKKKNPLPPGPGSYDIQGQFDKENMSTNDFSLIQSSKTTKPTSSFVSGNSRFGSMETMIPGPGHYTANRTSLSQKKSFRRASAQTPNSGISHKNELISGFRYINNNRRTSSIPNKIVKINHNDNGLVVKDLNSNNNTQQGNSQVQLGDGHGQNIIGQQSQGTEWSKSKVKRFQEGKVQGQHLGPGKYNADNKIMPRYKANPSSGFASESVRSYCDQIVYNTNSEMKAAIRKETGYKSNIPGPGSYEISMSKSQDQSNTPIVHQFFGSTCERFANLEPKKDFDTAPGQYYIDKGFNQNQARDPRVKISFGSTSEKDGTLKQLQKVQNQPGPGEYEMGVQKSIKESVVKKYNYGYKGNFGQQSNRFRSSTFQNKVGPGEYDLQPIKEYSNDYKKLQSASFKSSTTRNLAQNIQKEDHDQRDYDIGFGSIGNKAEKQKQYIQNLAKIDVQKPAFNTGTNRFQEPKLNQSAVNENKNKGLGLAIIDETKYDQIRKRATTSHEQKGNKQLLQTTKKYNAAFKAESKKIDFNAPKDGPGPGNYKSLSQWNKRSYNIKYQPGSN